MAREQQIWNEACHRYADSKMRNAFVAAANWADSNPHWIPVEEKLPPFDCIEDGSCRCSQPVLIYDPIRAWIYVGRYESDDLYGNTYWVYGNGKRPTREVCGGYEIDNITHWMPMPQPPKED